MKKFANISKKINQEFPNFEIKSVKKIGEGDNNRAFLINQNYIFRFPKRPDVKFHLKKEIDVLPKIRSLVHLEIPGFSFVSKEINFVGYKSIQGEFLTLKIYNSLEKYFQIKIQKALANFLSALHNIDLKTLSDCGLENMNYKEEYARNFERTQELIYPNISVNNRETITLLFTTYFHNKKIFEYSPTLIHNDFSTDHILFESGAKKISGIIDFGDMAIGDPYYDFMYLLDSFGPQLISQILKFYTGKIHKDFFEKVYFFSLANKLQILLGSMEDKDDNAIKVDYGNLEKWLNNFTFVT